MRMFGAFLVWMAWALAGCVAPAPKPDPLTVALVGRAVDFSTDPALPKDRRSVQSWTADGRTVLRNMGLFGADLSGRWMVRNGQYCQMLGYNTEWTCMRVTFTDGGQTVRFREIRDELSDYLINLFEVDRTGRFLP
jgi:hypothetical protein